MEETLLIHLLGKKMAGEATTEELEQLNQLLSSNPEAVYYAELLAELWVKEHPHQPGRTAAAYARHLERHSLVFSSRVQAAGKRTKVVPRFWWAASVLLVVLITAATFWWKNGVQQKKQTLVRISTSTGTRKKVALPDGSTVWLNTGSTLEFEPGMNTAKERMVILAGEAFFEVAPHINRPFLVKTGKIQVRVLGTAFNLRAYPGEKVTEATLLRGSIELTLNSKPYHKIMLRPKEKFALSDQETPSAASPATAPKALHEKLVIEDVQPIVVGNQEYLPEVSWLEDQLVFRQETLEELAPRMEKWFNVTIDIAPDALKKYHFTGAFHKETIEQALDALQLIQPFHYTLNNNHVSIRH